MKKQILILAIVLLIASTADKSLFVQVNIPEKSSTTFNGQAVNENRFFIAQDSADFSLNHSAPEYMDYKEMLTITVKIEEISNVAHTGISLKIELESGLNLAGGQDNTIDLGNFIPREVKEANFSITASQTFLTNPFVVFRFFLYKNGVQQYVITPDSENPLSYASFGITIQFPRLEIRGPLELKGFVVPRLDLIVNEERRLTYNVSNLGGSDLDNLTFRLEIDENIIKSGSLSHTSLDRLGANSHILISFNVTCITRIASSSVLNFYVESDFFGLREYTIKIQAFDWFNTYKYYNGLVLVTWPVMIVVFSAFALIITKYSWNKRVRRRQIAKLLEEKYGKSIFD